MFDSELWYSENWKKTNEPGMIPLQEKLNHWKRKLAIVPAYNETEKIEEVISGIFDSDNDIDVVVVDDGSTDTTGIKSRSSGAKVLRLSSNMGYGVAVQTGYKYAFEQGYDYVVQLDADGQHDPAYIPQILGNVMSGDADMVIGSRFLQRVKPAKMPANGYKAGLIRKTGIILFASLTTKLIGLKVTDPTSGYRAFNRRIITFLVRDFFPYDYPDADVIMIVHRAGFKIKETPMLMYMRGTGASMYKGLKPVSYVFKMFLSILMNMLRKRPVFP